MRLSKLHAALIAIALSVASVTPTLARTVAPPKPVNVPFVYYKLPNGLKVVISEDHIAPVVTVAVYYNIGFRVEPKGRTGFAHLFEHMMFQGSENVKKFEHAKFVEANGGSLNGSTRLDHTNYFETLPSNRVEMGLWLESDRMRSLDVSAENLKNQQNVVSEEVRVNVLNQPYASFEWLDLWMNANTNWFNAHNFYGDLTEIEAATLEDVRAFFKSYYAPNNAVLTVVGDVNTEEVKKMIEKHFASIPIASVPAKPDVTEPAQAEAIVSAGQADLVALARAILFEPHWPWRAAAELGAQVEAPQQYWRSQPRELKALFGDTRIGQR